MSSTCVACGAANGAVRTCWCCRASLPEPTLRIARPALYTGAELHFADGTVVRLPENRIVELGRAAPDRRIAMALADSPTVSRRHATVRLSGRGLTIEDRASSNGTYVEAAEAQPTVTCPVQPLIIGLGQTVQVRIVPTRDFDQEAGEQPVTPPGRRLR
jgi:pSer/pThr/pTyr-binding forkhead associated (FHA) protein